MHKYFLSVNMSSDRGTLTGIMWCSAFRVFQEVSWVHRHSAMTFYAACVFGAALWEVGQGEATSGWHCNTTRRS